MYWQEKDLCFLFFLPSCTVFARRSMRDTADQVSPNIHQAMTLFDLVLWPFVSLGPQVLPWHVLMKFLALASCYWRWDPCNLRCGCWKGFCPQQQGSAWFLGPKALGFLGRWTAHWILIQVLGSFVGGWSHWMWGGKSWDPGVLLVSLSTTSSSRRQCDGGGRSGLFSLCNSSYSLWCPLWPPKVVPKEADIRALLALLAQAHPIY